MENCTIEKCEQKRYKREYCNKHYIRIRRGRDVYASSIFDSRPPIIKDDVVLLPLGVDAKYGYALIDKEFAYLGEYKWGIDGHGYPRSRIDGVIYKLHHIVAGKPQPGEDTDHKDRDKKNNRKSNLRRCTRTYNAANKSIRSDSTTGYKGVHWDKRKLKYTVCISKENKVIRLGTFSDKKTAAKAYNQKAQELFGEFAWLNPL